MNEDTIYVRPELTAPVSIQLMARRLRVKASWLRSEAEANRIPHLMAGTQILFDPDLVESVLLKRARENGQEQD